MNAVYAKFQELKQTREKERAKAIRDGFLADPDKKTSLDKAITPVGTCTEMCPEFERVERIVQNMVDKAEKVHDEETGKDNPSEDRMVKRFRRSAAGYDEQLPSDIRTPATLRKTLDYLLDKVIGGEERLATIHKFVWDRTRGIRNDFSIQQVTNVDDVKVAVDCYERIARFHILSLHQLSNPDNLMEGEHFDAHQEREQLNNTLLSLLYYYDDNRQRMHSPNEGEFRAYCIIFELQSQHPDLEDRIQSWPKHLLDDMRVQTAFKLYMAAGNSLFEQGPLRPLEPFAIAQSKVGTFWKILSSTAVPYIMACVAEIYFAPVRFAALDALWRSCKSAPAAQQAKSRDWELAEVTNFLGFDTEGETKDFCAAFDLYFATDDNGDEYLDVTSNSAHSLDQSSIPSRQSFSHTYVEKKRYHRTLTAVINGVPVAEAIRQGLVEPEREQDSPEQDEEAFGEDDQSMFVSEAKPTATSIKSSSFGSPFSTLNPEASTFLPKFGESAPALNKPAEKSTFGQLTGFGSSSFGSSGFSAGFGSPSSSSSFANPLAGPKPVERFSFGGFTQPPKELKFNPTPSTGPAASQTTAPSPTSDSVKTPTFTGFNFGPAVTTSATTPTTPAAATSTSSAIPPIFGPRATLPAVPGPSEESKTKIGSATTPFQIPKLAPFVEQPAKASESASQLTEKRQIGFPPAPAFMFQPQASQQSATPAQTISTPSQSTPAGGRSSEGFSFKPTTPSAPASTTPTFPSMTPPLASETPPKPASEGFKFPPVQLPTFKPADQAQAKPSPGNSHAEPSTEPVARPTTSAKASPGGAGPPQVPITPSTEPVFAEVDRDQLVANVAKVALLRKNGLMQHYIEYTLPDLIRTALNQHRIEVHDAAVVSIRSRVLARKFGYIWRTRAWKNKLNRRAKNRRHQFAQTMRAEQERKKRSEEELEEIIRATQETKRLQKEVEQATEARKSRHMIQVDSTPGKVAGQKRKSFSGQNPSGPAVSQMGASTGTPSNPGHKRSRTMGTFSEPSISTRSSVPPVPSFRASTFKPAHHVSVFSARSTLGRSVSNQDLRPSISGQKVDTTSTDYFRLKAMGIDPDISIIPDTEQTLALRKRRQEEERKAILAKSSRRAGPAGSVRSSSTAASPHAASSISVESPPKSKETTPKTNSLPPVEDDFLRQIREAREAMAEQARWFKEQTVTLEKEIKQDEEFRTSRESQPLEASVGTTPSTSGVGLARSNGYDYQPSQANPGTSLSRTERRIRMTGAHGLATKPLRSGSDYIPVAMSKRSAMGYSVSSGQISGLAHSPERKRSHDDDDHIEQQSHNNISVGMHHAAKRPRSDSEGSAWRDNGIYGTAKAAYKHTQNPYELLQSGSRDNGDEEEGGVEDSVEDEAQHSQAVRGGDEVEDDGEDVDRYRQPYHYHTQHSVDADEVDIGAHDNDDQEGEEGEEGEEEGLDVEEELMEEYEDEDEDEDEQEEYESEEEEEDELVEDDDAGYGDSDSDSASATPESSTNPAHVLSRAASNGPGASMDDALVLSDSD
ncbi:hypothetical protein A1O3_08237 [Capronia epimyces CBS 606.96]|uniref:SAC3/GANP/THP3 conserved domain-containing protein n=1 Tax=Capronia epimyces CBS 606.96 TaxID=1182542 RepID=W9XSK9_9EURO|nr:uncharacterized protein A1O3_08237 [Capronia epimyces CBS 606.96]EXJ79951.1 hypothetical protein A1O3_08237 [Capronia epimyces CBS 606.96]